MASLPRPIRICYPYPCSYLHLLSISIPKSHLDRVEPKSGASLLGYSSPEAGATNCSVLLKRMYSVPLLGTRPIIELLRYIVIVIGIDIDVDGPSPQPKRTKDLRCVPSSSKCKLKWELPIRGCSGWRWVPARLSMRSFGSGPCDALSAPADLAPGRPHHVIVIRDHDTAVPMQPLVPPIVVRVP